MTMNFVKATDENGINFDALTNNNTRRTDGRQNVWVFTDKASGFGDDVGRLNLHQLKEISPGVYGP